MSFRVRVGSWTCSRLVSLFGGTVVMEIARYACRHCSTCSARVDYVHSRLNGEGEWDRAEGGLVVKLAYPADRATDPASIAGFLQEKLGLSVAAITA